MKITGHKRESEIGIQYFSIQLEWLDRQINESWILLISKEKLSNYTAALNVLLVALSKSVPDECNIMWINNDMCGVSSSDISLIYAS